MRTLLTILAAALLTMPALAQTRYAWVGSNGDWSEPANWSPNGVPAATDTAVVESASIRVVTLTANTTVAGLEVAGLGAIAGDFDLTVTGHFLWSGGGGGLESFQGNGDVIIASGATAHLADPTTSYKMSDGRTLVNDGMILWDGSGSWNGQGRLVNMGELVLAMGEAAIVFSSLADGITNSTAGVIRRTGTGTARYSGGLVNDGLLRVESGALDLGGFNLTGTTGSGSVEIADGAVLIASGGNHAFASITGDALTLTRDRVTVADAYDVATTRIAVSGTLALDADGTIEDLVMEGGALDGSGTLTVTGTMDWTGGQMAGSGTTVLGPTIPLTIGGAASVSLSGTRTLRTEGPVTWTGDADIGSGTGTTVFENAGTLTSSGPGERTTSFLTFRNTGTLIHDGGTLRFQSPMDNEGEVRIENGTLGFNSNGTDTGRYELAETGRMEFIFRTRTLTETAEVVGTGTVAFTGGTVVNRATWRPGGDAVGTLTVEGNWPAMEPEGVLAFDIGGTTPGTDFDQLDVSGTFAAGGTVRVALTDGFTPSVAEPLLIVAAAGGASGSFDAAELPATTSTGYVQAMSAGVLYGLGEPVANEDAPLLPAALALHAPYPNPALARATVRYDVPAPGAVRIALYDVLGREVAVLAEADHAAGVHEATLDGAGLPSGLYFVRMTAPGGFTQTRPLTRVP